jgi:hypothetical protein
LYVGPPDIYSEYSSDDNVVTALVESLSMECAPKVLTAVQELQKGKSLELWRYHFQLHQNPLLRGTSSLVS